MERGTRARRARASREAARVSRLAARASRSHSPGQRDGENAPLVDALVDLAEPGLAHELVHLGLRSPAHHPRRTAAVAGQGAGDELELRMPRLIRIDEESSRWNGIGHACKRRAYLAVVGEQLV